MCLTKGRERAKYGKEVRACRHRIEAGLGIGACVCFLGGVSSPMPLCNYGSEWWNV